MKRELPEERATRIVAEWISSGKGYPMTEDDISGMLHDTVAHWQALRNKVKCTKNWSEKV